MFRSSTFDVLYKFTAAHTCKDNIKVFYLFSFFILKQNILTKSHQVKAIGKISEIYLRTSVFTRHEFQIFVSESD